MDSMIAFLIWATGTATPLGQRPMPSVLASFSTTLRLRDLALLGGHDVGGELEDGAVYLRPPNPT